LNSYFIAEADIGSKADASLPLFDITSYSFFLLDPKTLKTLDAALAALLMLLGRLPCPETMLDRPMSPKLNGAASLLYGEPIP
jgi:hypothetical protein